MKRLSVRAYNKITEQQKINHGEKMKKQNMNYILYLIIALIASFAFFGYDDAIRRQRNSAILDKTSRIIDERGVILNKAIKDLNISEDDQRKFDSLGNEFQNLCKQFDPGN